MEGMTILALTFILQSPQIVLNPEHIQFLIFEFLRKKMNKNLEKKLNAWHMIVIYDLLSLPGQSVYNVINILLKLLNIQFVALSDLEGAGTAILARETQTSLIPINEFLKQVIFVEQFDWGDFFLFSAVPNSWQELEKKSYPELIALTETTLRAVDDTYIYMYTPYDEVVQLIKENYTIEEIKKGKLEDLDYPS